jgi:hypothetical protein
MIIGLWLMVAAFAKASWNMVIPGGEVAWISTHRTILAMVCVAELIASAAFISGLAPILMRRLGILMFAGFAVVSASEGLFHYKSCHCFGAIQVNPWHTALLDLAALAALVYLKPSRISWSRSSTIIFLVMSMVGLSSLAAVWFHQSNLAQTGILSSESSRLIVLEPTTWLQKRFSLAEFIDIGPVLVKRRWIILLVHHDCPDCIAAIPLYEAHQSQFASGDARLAIIEMPPYAQGNEELPSTKSFALIGRLKNDRDWFAKTPIALMIQDGIVLQEKEGEGAVNPDPQWWAN